MIILLTASGPVEAGARARGALLAAAGPRVGRDAEVRAFLAGGSLGGSPGGICPRAADGAVGAGITGRA